MNILVIAAHPDDEVLGCGGTIAKYAEAGARVDILFLSDGETSRDNWVETKISTRKNMARQSGNILGANSVTFLDFPDNNMDTVPLLTIVKKIEKFSRKFAPDLVLTHSPKDLNVDHTIAFRATMTAFRPQSREAVKEILCFEVLSSSDWYQPDQQFTPNLFEDISGTIEKKYRALQVYQTEMRDWPHARSYEAVESLQKMRGAKVAIEACEAFEIARIIR